MNFEEWWSTLASPGMPDYDDAPQKNVARMAWDAARQRENALAESIKALKIGHNYCEDSWYSCPLAEGGCADDRWPKDKCNCGADEHNAKVDAILQSLCR